MLAMFTQTVNSLRSFELTVSWGFLRNRRELWRLFDIFRCPMNA